MCDMTHSWAHLRVPNSVCCKKSHHSIPLLIHIWLLLTCHMTQRRFCPSIDLVCSTYIAGASFFIGLFCWKIRRKLNSWKVDDRVFPRCWTSLQHFATLSFGGIESFLGLFCMNPWKLTRKIDRRKDALEFARADLSTVQTKSIDGQKHPHS